MSGTNRTRPFPSPAFYHYFRGSVFGVMDLTGVKQLNVTIAEGGGSSSRCLLRITWA